MSFVVVLLVSACGKDRVAQACNRPCVEGERCAADRGLCVPLGPPLISIDAPLPGSLVSSETFHVTGLVTDDDRPYQSAQLSVNDGGSWVELGVDVAGAFDQVVPTPNVDGEASQVLVRVVDGYGAEGHAELPVLFDRVAPHCQVVSPSAGATVGGASVDVELEVTDGSHAFGPAAVSLDQGATWKEQPVVAGRARFTVPLPADREGLFPLKLTGKDAAGNGCTASLELQVDTRAPSLTEQAPLANDTLGRPDAGATFEVRFSVHDASAVSLVEVQAPPSPTWKPASLQGDVASFTWTLPAGDDGTARVLRLRATDALGNVATHDVTVTVDVLAPACTLVAPTAGASFNAATGPTTLIRWTVVDGNPAPGLGEVSTDDGVTWTQAALSSGGAAQFAWAFAATDDGAARTIRVRGVDGAGNTCSERSAAVTVDVVGPALTVTGPARDAVLGAATAQFKGAVSDGSGQVAQVTVDFADGTGPRRATLSGGGWSLTVPVPAGEDFVAHAVTVKATDAAGNSTTLPWRVVVDRVAPLLTVPSPTEGQLFGSAQLGAGATVPCQLQATDGDTQVSLDVQQGAAWAPVSGGAFDAPTDPTADNTPVSFVFRARDTAGNEAQLVRTFRVDRVAPTVTSTSPANGAKGTANTFRVQFSEAIGVQGASLPLSFTPAAPAGASFALSGSNTALTVTGLQGLQSYSAVLGAGRVTDLAGNPAQAMTAVSFLTLGARPTSGAVLLSSTATQTVEWFRSSVDADGVVSLVVRVVDPGTGVRNWLLGWLDPRTGQWALQDTYPATDTGASLLSFAETLPNGTRRHRASAWFGRGESGAMFTLGTAGSTPLGALQVATPLDPTYEQPGSDYGGFVSNGVGWNWHRTPNPDVQVINWSFLGLATGPTGAWGFSQSQFEVASGQLTVFGRTYECGCKYLPCQCMVDAAPRLGVLASTSANPSQPLCDPTFDRYVMTPTAGFYLSRQCAGADPLTSWTGWTVWGNPWSASYVPGAVPPTIVADPYLSVSGIGTGVDDGLLLATSGATENFVAIKLYSLSATSQLQWYAPIKTITVEALEPFKPQAQAAFNTGHLVFDPLTGPVPAVLYLAAPSRLMYRE